MLEKYFLKDYLLKIFSILFLQVRSEKALLEKQEQMLKLREEQLIQERRRQEKKAGGAA